METKNFINEIKNNKAKYFGIGVIVIIFLIFVKICSWVMCPQVERENFISDENQIQKTEIINQYEHAKDEIENEIKRLNQEMKDIQMKIQQEKQKMVRLQQETKIKISKISQTEDTNIKEEKDHRSQKEKREMENQYDSHSFIIKNGILQGTFTSSDQEKLQQVKEVIKKYATIVEEKEQGFSFTSDDKENREKLVNLGTYF